MMWLLALLGLFLVVFVLSWALHDEEAERERTLRDIRQMYKDKETNNKSNK